MDTNIKHHFINIKPTNYFFKSTFKEKKKKEKRNSYMKLDTVFFKFEHVLLSYLINFDNTFNITFGKWHSQKNKYGTE